MFGALSCAGQSGLLSNIRSRRIPLAKDSVVIDTLSIVPGSVYIRGVDKTEYTVNPQKAQLIWKHRPAGDSVLVSYRVLPLNLSKTYYHKDRRQIETNSIFSYHPDIIKAGSSGAFDPVEYSGSYGRTISAGNSQDVVLNSHLNFAASGYILDSIRLDAALTDNTVPFQPEGNTQRLSAFDQIFIRLQKRRSSLQLGDFTLERPKDYFLNFNKRVQGAYLQSAFRIGAADNAFGLSGSVAKGQFARNIFQGAEGNQGPYKLTGNNGEQYFIVLAGTEKVYINGLIQERGEAADYVINYNTAEIRFMPRRLITKDSRIQVEFEYQDRTYLNSLVYAWDDLQLSKKWNLHLNIYSNQDAKNQGYTQNLTGEQKNFLSSIGDSIQQAFYPVISTDTFAAGKILYKLIDTTVAGVHYDTVFKYSTNRDSARFAPGFSFVGQGRGDYVISSVAANGRVYDFVPRVAGIPQGDYAPVQLLITPKSQQVITLASTYLIDSSKTLFVEGALSNRNPNLFGAANTAAHLGGAGKLRYTEARGLGARDSLHRRALLWTNDVAAELVQASFRAIAPYRNAEFGRDWNVPQTDERRPDEVLLNYTTGLRDRRANSAAYSFGYYRRGAAYEGFRNELSALHEGRRWRYNATGNLLQSVDTFQRTQYFRPSLLAEYHFQQLLQATLGFKYQGEYNRITSKTADSLRSNAFAFDIASAYLVTPESGKTRFGITYTLRRDQLPRGLSFIQQSHSHTVDARLGLAQWKGQVITFTGSYRRLLVDDTGFNTQKPEETLLGRATYNGTLLRKILQLQTLYEFGSGQEQKRSYTYLEVPAGQGLYYWIDYNGDGVQQANEFELALYPDQKKYIRVLTPTNEYVRVNYINFSQSLTLEPGLWWSGQKIQGLKKLIAAFSDVASLQVANRLLSEEGLRAYNPFAPTLHNDNIILTSNSINNTLYFNRAVAAYGADYNYLHTSNKNLLTYGVEGGTTTEHILRGRANVTAALTTTVTARNGLRGYRSALDDGRSYAVHSNSIEPSLTWIHRATLRLTGSIRYEQRDNEAAYGGQKATIRRLDIETRFSKPVTGSITARAGYSGIAYNGLSTAPVAYTMLDALQPGANFLWYTSWERRVTKGIELSLEYEGRKPGEGQAVHTGRMTIRAIL